MKSKLKVVFAVLGGFLGGGLSLSLFDAFPVHASERTMTLTELQLVDTNGQPYVELKQEDGDSSELAFINQKGNALLKMGIDSNGIPYFHLLSDEFGEPTIKTNIVLDGANQSAKLIFKDNNGRNRMIIGLDPDDPNEEPYFVYFDKDQKKKTVFGSYSYE